MNLAINHDPFDPHKWFVKFLIGVFIVVLIIICNSCSCDYHLRKAKSKCNQTALSDTLIIHDTIVTKGVQRDTIFKHHVQKDTVFVHDGQLVMKYYYNIHDSTVYLKGQCLPDTVFYERQIISNNLTLAPDPIMRYKWWIIGLFAVMLLIIVILRR